MSCCYQNENESRNTSRIITNAKIYKNTFLWLYLISALMKSLCDYSSFRFCHRASIQIACRHLQLKRKITKIIWSEPFQCIVAWLGLQVCWKVNLCPNHRTFAAHCKFIFQDCPAFSSCPSEQFQVLLVAIIKKILTRTCQVWKL